MKVKFRRAPAAFAAVMCLAGAALAEPVQPIDLKAYTGISPVDGMGADWQAPHGRQVLDGIPFQIDGVISFSGSNTTQRAHPGRTNLADIHTTAHFERLHLLCGADADGPKGTLVARIHFLYADGSEAASDLRMGENIQYWAAFRHKAGNTWTNSEVHEVWRAQNSSAAASDKYLRLFHVPLANPSPEKEVKSLAVESGGTQCGLMILAMSVGPASAEALPDTIAPLKNPLPDLTTRTGEPARAEGFLKNTNGLPIAGAHVRVSAVREFNSREGRPIQDDPAVGTMAETDANGHFILPPLPDNRICQLVALAQGYRSDTFRGLDPKSDPIEIRLKSQPGGTNAGKFAVHGKVLMPDGKPLPFVVLETDGVGFSGGTSWGGDHGFPNELMTDTNGLFTVAREEPFDRVQLRVRLPGLAPAMVWLDVTNDLQTIQMGVGGKVTGRVLKDGKPLAGVRVGVSGQERNSKVYAGNFEATTDTNGVFSFDHLPMQTSWELYGLMSSLKSYGALPPRPVRTGDDGSATDEGDLAVARGLHIYGQVKTKNGEPLPSGVQVYAGYENGWDSQNVKPDATGHFKIEGLAAGILTVSVNANITLTGDNRSLDQFNSWRLVGKLEQDKDDLLLMVANRERQYNNYNGTGNGQLPMSDQPQSRPLYGAEPGGPPFIVLAGGVVDDATGKPVPEFKIIPGYKPPVGPPMFSPPKTLVQEMLQPFATKSKQVPRNERIHWEYPQSETISNGMFSENFVPLSSSPVLAIEAKGYEPLETDPTNQSVTNLVLRLKRGAGPNGVVLLPDGTPAEGATVVYGATQEQFSMTGTAIQNYGRGESAQTTGKDGKFSFLAKSEGVELFASHPQGWAQLPTQNGGVDGVKLRLKPWAALTGILVDSNNVPIAGTSLALTMFHDWQTSGGAMVNLQGRVTTDAGGRFTFTNVPPSRVEVQRLIPFKTSGSSGSYSYMMQTWLVPAAGITNDLGKITIDQPPPESMMEQVKHRLGM